MEQKEMNFFDLCKACVKVIMDVVMWAWQVLCQMLRLSWRMWYVVITLTLLGIAGGLYYSRPDNKMYEVTGIVYLNGPTLNGAKTRFEALNCQAPPKLNPNQTLWKMLDAEDGSLFLSHFEAFYLQDGLHDGVADYIDWGRSAPIKDTLNVRVPDMLALRFRIRWKLNVALAQEKIMAYMNADPAFQEAYKMDLANRMREYQYDKDQIEKLDSLTSVFYFEQGEAYDTPQLVTKKRGQVLVGERKIHLFTDQIDRFFHKKQLRDTRLAYCTAPVVMQNTFVMSPRPINRISKSMIIGCIIGWLIGCLMGFLIERRKDVFAWLNRGR